MTQPAAFTINIPDTKLAAIRARVEAYSWFPAPANEQGFAYGMSTPVMQDIQRYWLETYDWRAAEAELNRWPQFTAEVDGQTIHFVHVVGEAKGKRPLLITHGWPGSVYEFWQAIGPLAFPSEHGGWAEDAFDLVIPSLPGYGFSGKPASPLGQRATAALWDKLMRDVLGYPAYLAQGGDWGSMVTSWLGKNHGTADGKGGCRGIHLNMMAMRPTPALPQTAEETAWLQRSQGIRPSLVLLCVHTARPSRRPIDPQAARTPDAQQAAPEHPPRKQARQPGIEAVDYNVGAACCGGGRQRGHEGDAAGHAAAARQGDAHAQLPVGPAGHQRRQLEQAELVQLHV